MGYCMMFKRAFALPCSDTFTMPPVQEFVRRHLAESRISVDPFARNYVWATYTNDLNPQTAARFHMDAEEFCLMLLEQGVQSDLGIFDPPYSPRQIRECYSRIGLPIGMNETQNARLYRRVRDALDALMVPGGVVLSFGWNSSGMGRKRGYELTELLLVAHGGAHNDTICIAEQKPA